MIHLLQSCGWSFNKQEHSQQGFRSFSCITKNQVQLQFREVLDEALYLQSSKLEHFKPFSHDTPALGADGAADFEFVSFIERSLLPTTALMEHLNITKEFDLQAVVIKVPSLRKDFPKFAYKPIDQAQAEVLLIHFGPSCFDVLILDQKQAR
jgi:hypothetical protein